MTKIQIDKIKGRFNEYRNSYIEFNNFTNPSEYNYFKSQTQKIIQLDDISFINYLQDIHPTNYCNIGNCNISETGLDEVFFEGLNKIEYIYNLKEHLYEINGDKYMLSTITTDKYKENAINKIIRNPNLDKKIFENRIIITNYINGNGLDFLKNNKINNNINFDTNNYSIGENGIYINPKNLNFITLDNLLLKI